LARLASAFRSRCIFSLAGRPLDQCQFAFIDLFHTPKRLFPEHGTTPINLS